MSEHDTFGPRLRSERERRGISLGTIVTVTKVGADLWTGLEKNDFSKWPSGIFARAFVRDYARAIGLDADEVVDEFCRLFPDIGDRRVARIIKAQAELIGHDPEKVDEASLLPPQGDRRVGGARAQGGGQGAPNPAGAADGFRLDRHRVHAVSRCGSVGAGRHELLVVDRHRRPRLLHDLHHLQRRVSGQPCRRLPAAQDAGALRRPGSPRPRLTPGFGACQLLHIRSERFFDAPHGRAAHRVRAVHGGCGYSLPSAEYVFRSSARPCPRSRARSPYPASVHNRNVIGIAHIPSSVGPLTLAARDTRVCLLHFGAETPAVRERLSTWYPAEVITPHADPAGGVSALEAYFAGDLEALDRLEVEFNGTPFQKRVWEALRAVRPGRTASYADLARAIGCTDGGACRRRGERRQPDRRDRPLPPHHRFERHTDGIRRWTRTQTLAARTRGMQVDVFLGIKGVRCSQLCHSLWSHACIGGREERRGDERWLFCRGSCSVWWLALSPSF